MNAFKPDLMTADERPSEIAEILAAGLMRLRSRQSSPQSADFGDSSLDCAADQSAHSARRLGAVGVPLLLTSRGQR